MSKGPKTVFDIYEELITLQKEWREETKSLLTQNHTAISTLNSIREDFSRFKWTVTGLIIAALIISITGLIYTGKLKICKVQFSDFSLTTNNCLNQND